MNRALIVQIFSMQDQQIEWAIPTYGAMRDDLLESYGQIETAKIPDEDLPGDWMDLWGHNMAAQMQLVISMENAKVLREMADAIDKAIEEEQGGN